MGGAIKGLERAAINVRMTEGMSRMGSSASGAKNVDAMLNALRAQQVAQRKAEAEELKRIHAPFKQESRGIGGRKGKVSRSLLKCFRGLACKDLL